MNILKKQYQISIAADTKKVWFSLWDLTHYQDWTSAFCQGSYAKTLNWEKGSRVHFLDPNGNGMYSDVAENIPQKCMDFVHIGNLLNFEEQAIDDETQHWSMCHEKYTLVDQGKSTVLVVEVDALEEYVAFFETNFPKALLNIKRIAENL